MAVPSRVLRKSFREVFEKTRPVSLSGLRLRFMKASQTSVAFVVSTKFAKNATERNFWKRRGRAVFSKQKAQLKKGTYLFFFQPEIKKLSFLEFEKTLIALLKKADLFNE